MLKRGIISPPLEKGDEGGFCKFIYYVCIRWQIPAFLAAVSFFVWLSWAGKEAHVFKEDECFKCHLSLSGSKKVFIKDIDKLCEECHKDMGLSHPSGIRPSMALPAVFPVDWRGRVTCTTCHDIHKKDAKGDLLLRGGNKAGRVFCFLCHKDTIGKHAGSNQPAHSGSGFEVIDWKNPVDDLSLECLTCHDSSIAVSKEIGMGAWSHRTGGEHPIGIAYMEAYRKGGFNHPSTFKKYIKLYGGKVGCGSCHNMYSKEKYDLAIDNKGSALCMACHIK